MLSRPPLSISNSLFTSSVSLSLSLSLSPSLCRCLSFPQLHKESFHPFLPLSCHGAAAIDVIPAGRERKRERNKRWCGMEREGEASPEQFNALAIFASTQVKMSYVCRESSCDMGERKEKGSFIFTHSRFFYFLWSAFDHECRVTLSDRAHQLNTSQLNLEKPNK